jgi:hypothetical protein
MRKAELGMAVLLGVLSLYVMWKAGEPPGWNPEAGRFATIGFSASEGLGGGAWPFYLAVGMLASSVWVGVNAVRGRTPASRSAEPFLDGFAIRMLAKVGGGLVGFLLLIPPIGFYGGMLVFLLYYIFILGRHGLALSLAIAIGMPVASFFFFDVAMRVVLPKGYLLEDLFIPLYDIFL